MKALILAAGQGTRIRSVHGDRPKCLIRFNNSTWTILDQQIDSLFSVGVEEIGIVVGYEKDQIVSHVARFYPRRLGRFRFIENPSFAETNNIYSVWLAREWLKNSCFVCLNADVAFDGQTLLPAVRSIAPVTMIVDPEWRDETMKVVIANNQVTRMNKQISRDEFSGTYIGITVFAAGVHERFFATVDDLVRKGNRHSFFNAAVQQLADEGLRVGYTETSGLPWAEIDDPGDLAFAREYVFPQLFPDAAA
jgi:choline kinase